MQKWQYSLLSLWPAMTWLIKNDPTSVHNLDSVLILWPAMTWLMKTDPTSVHHPASVLILWPTMTWLNKNDPMSVHNQCPQPSVTFDLVTWHGFSHWECSLRREIQFWEATLNWVYVVTCSHMFLHWLCCTVVTDLFSCWMISLEDLLFSCDSCKSALICVFKLSWGVVKHCYSLMDSLSQCIHCACVWSFVWL